MTMDAYISKLSKAAFFQLRRLAQLRSYVSPKDAESLVHAFITSRLDYCNALFAGLPLHSISHLYIQNSAARILTPTKRSAHITPILIKLHWLPVSSRITYKILLLTFKSLNGLAPPYLSDLLSPYVPPRSLRSLGCELLTVPRFRLSSMGGRSFSVIAPKLWNSIPLALRTITSLSVFKSQLKTYLFTQYFQSYHVQTLLSSYTTSCDSLGVFTVCLFLLHFLFFVCYLLTLSYFLFTFLLLLILCLYLYFLYIIVP